MFTKQPVASSYGDEETRLNIDRAMDIRNGRQQSHYMSVGRYHQFYCIHDLDTTLDYCCRLSTHNQMYRVVNIVACRNT